MISGVMLLPGGLIHDTYPGYGFVLTDAQQMALAELVDIAPVFVVTEAAVLRALGVLGVWQNALLVVTGRSRLLVLPDGRVLVPAGVPQ